MGLIMNDCLFCKIINGEIPSIKVYENHGSIAFMDIKPVNPGHVLIVSKKHFENMLEADDETLADVAVAAKKVALAVKNALKADGINLAANNGRVAGQVIFHLHWHIIPRFENDGLRLWPGKEISTEELKEIAKKIEKEL